MGTDYNQQFKQTLVNLQKRESLLLHSCCAVCAGGVLAREFAVVGKCDPVTAKKRLTDYFDVTLYFYNPNIDSREEYDKRAGELEKLKGVFPLRGIVVEDYRPKEFLVEIKGHEDGQEGACGRCTRCVSLRLLKAAQYAKNNGFDRFSTVLSVSPHKNEWEINGMGLKAQRRHNVPFLPADFKKEHGFLAATATAKELGLYRQSYCGCAYSKK